MVCELCEFLRTHYGYGEPLYELRRHLRMFHPEAGLDNALRMCYPALDLNGQGTPAMSGLSRSRRRASEARRTGA